MEMSSETDSPTEAGRGGPGHELEELAAQPGQLLLQRDVEVNSVRYHTRVTEHGGAGLAEGSRAVVLTASNEIGKDYRLVTTWAGLEGLFQESPDMIEGKDRIEVLQLAVDSCLAFAVSKQDSRKISMSLEAPRRRERRKSKISLGRRGSVRRGSVSRERRASNVRREEMQQQLVDIGVAPSLLGSPAQPQQPKSAPTPNPSPVAAPHSEEAEEPPAPAPAPAVVEAPMAPPAMVKKEAEEKEEKKVEKKEEKKEVNEEEKKEEKEEKKEEERKRERGRDKPPVTPASATQKRADESGLARWQRPSTTASGKSLPEDLDRMDEQISVVRDADLVDAAHWASMSVEVRRCVRIDYERDLFHNPDDGHTMKRLGYLNYLDEDYEAAAVMFQRAIDRGVEGNATFWLTTARCYFAHFKLARVEEMLMRAYEAYSMALRFNSNIGNPDVWFESAHVHVALGSFVGAAQTLGRIVRDFQSYGRLSSVLFLGGQILKQLGEYEQAIAYFYHLTDAPPAPYSIADMWLIVGRTYFLWAETNPAVWSSAHMAFKAAFDLLKASQPAQVAKYPEATDWAGDLATWVGAGRLYFENGDYTLAIDALTMVLDPNQPENQNPELWQMLAFSYRQLSQEENALQSLQNTLDLDPGSLQAKDTLMSWLQKPKEFSLKVERPVSEDIMFKRDPDFAALLVQKMLRVKRAIRVVNEAREQRRAAIKLQCQARRRAGKAKVQRRRRRKQAATQIQGQVRRRQATKRVAKVRQRKKDEYDSATKIQSMARGVQTRSKHKRFTRVVYLRETPQARKERVEAEERAAASRAAALESAQRSRERQREAEGLAAEGAAKHEVEQRRVVAPGEAEGAALKIQSLARGRADRRRVDELRDLKQDWTCAVCRKESTARYRRCRVCKTPKTVYVPSSSSSPAPAARAARRESFQEPTPEEEERSALALQRVARGRLGRRHARNERKRAERERRHRELMSGVVPVRNQTERHAAVVAVNSSVVADEGSGGAFLRTVLPSADSAKDNSVAHFKRTGVVTSGPEYVRHWEDKLAFSLQYYETKLELRKCVAHIKVFNPKVSAHEAFCALAAGDGSVGEAIGRLSDSQFVREMRHVCATINVERFAQLESGDATYFKVLRRREPSAPETLSPAAVNSARSKLMRAREAQAKQVQSLTAPAPRSPKAQAKAVAKLYSSQHKCKRGVCVECQMAKALRKVQSDPALREIRRQNKPSSTLASKTAGTSGDML